MQYTLIVKIIKIILNNSLSINFKKILHKINDKYIFETINIDL